ncbi:MAG: hypothetical protein WCG27_06715 [Pseudomonadota bacterium]
MMRNKRTLLALYFLPPLLLIVGLIIPDFLAFLQTGKCPAAPPDRLAYTCSMDVFFDRVLFSPFALGGMFGITLLWSVIVTAVIFFLKFLRLFRKNKLRPPF